jgi:hypothetical protein
MTVLTVGERNSDKARMALFTCFTFLNHEKRA